uniref:Uncharacterized protein n=1 Tax=Arundo donax TaxID=35708 RepID=A0A0A9GRD8_ARUDO
MPAAIDEKNPPPPENAAPPSWSLDPIAGDLRGQRESPTRARVCAPRGWARVWGCVWGDGGSV